MNFLKKLLGKGAPLIDWEKLKYSDKVYPKHSFTLLKLTMEDGEIGTGWIDKAYGKYEFKEFCPYHLKISIDLTDQVAEENADLDMGTIEDFFSDELKTICLSHFISRLVSEKGIDIDFYVEKDEPVEQFLRKASLAQNRLVTFTYKIEFDPKWKDIKRLINL